MLKRNPGATLLWITENYARYRGLFHIGEPSEIYWYAEGRAATDDEVMKSVESGLPTLVEMAVKDGRGAMEELRRMIAQAAPLLPRAPVMQVIE